MGEGRQGFWRSVPGVLTVAAGLITAIGGILAILLQVGVIGGDERPAPPAQAPPGSTASVGEPAPEAAGGGGPWSDAVAVFTGTDGTTIQARAETVRYCISAGTAVSLDDVQDVPFEQMTSLEVVRADDQFASGGRADVVIELVDGQRLEGTIGSGCDFFGFNDLGRVGPFYPQVLRRIDFQR